MDEHYSEWDRVDWDDVLPRVLLYAAWQIKRHQLELDAEELAAEAYEKAVTGKRKWCQKKCTLYKFLVGIIRSDISTCLKKSKTEEKYFDKNFDQYKLYNNCSCHDAKSSTPEDKLIYERQKENLLYYINDSEDLLGNIARLMLDDDITSPCDIADILYLDVQTINNAKKRLRRLVLKFLDQESATQQATTPKSGVENVG